MVPKHSAAGRHCAQRRKYETCCLHKANSQPVYLSKKQGHMLKVKRDGSQSQHLPQVCLLHTFLGSLELGKEANHGAADSTRKRV